jgi:hypothetical protein
MIERRERQYGQRRALRTHAGLTASDPVAQLSGERLDCGVGVCFQLLDHERLISGGVVQCFGALAARGEGRHEVQHDAGTERLVIGQATPPYRGVAYVPLHFRLHREVLDRLSVGPGQRRPLALHPPVELRRVPKMESVEERATIRLDCLTERTAAARLPKGVHITRHSLGVEAQVGCT